MLVSYMSTYYVEDNEFNEENWQRSKCLVIGGELNIGLNQFREMFSISGLTTSNKKIMSCFDLAVSAVSHSYLMRNNGITKRIEQYKDMQRETRPVDAEVQKHVR